MKTCLGLCLVAVGLWVWSVAAYWELRAIAEFLRPRRSRRGRGPWQGE